MAGKKSGKELRRISSVSILRSIYDKCLEKDKDFNLSALLEKAMLEYLSEDLQENLIK